MRLSTSVPSLVAVTLLACTTITEDQPARKNPVPNGPVPIPVVDVQVTVT